MSDYTGEIEAVRGRILARIAQLGLTPQIAPHAMRKALRGQHAWRHGPTLSVLFELAARLQTSASELLGGAPPATYIVTDEKMLQAALEITLTQTGANLGNCPPKVFAEIVMLVHEALIAMERDQPNMSAGDRRQLANWMAGHAIRRKRQEKEAENEQLLGTLKHLADLQHEEDNHH